MKATFNSLEYYSQYIFGLIIIYVMLILVFKLLNNKNTRLNNKSFSFDFYGKTEHVQVIHDELSNDQANLRIKFLIAATIIKSAFWVKAPYLFAL